MRLPHEGGWLPEPMLPPSLPAAPEQPAPPQFPLVPAEPHMGPAVGQELSPVKGTMYELPRLASPGDTAPSSEKAASALVPTADGAAPLHQYEQHEPLPAAIASDSPSGSDRPPIGRMLMSLEQRPDRSSDGMAVSAADRRDDRGDTPKDIARHEPTAAADKEPDDAPRAAGGGDTPKPPIKPPETPGAAEPDEPEDQPEQPKPATNEPGRYQGPINVEFIQAPRELPPDTPRPPQQPPERGDGDPSGPDSGAGESRPAVERHQEELRQIVQGAEAVVLQADAASGRVYTTGEVIDGQFHFNIVDAPGGTPEELTRDLETAQALARTSIADLEDDRMAAGAPPIDYLVDDMLMYDTINGGAVGVQTVSRLIGRHQAGETLLTYATFTLPETESGQELLYAQIYAQAGRVTNVSVSAIPAADVPDYLNCLEMFGSYGVVNDIMQGKFETEDEAVLMLREVVQSVDAVGVYPRAAIDLALGNALRIGFTAKADRAVDEGVRSERLARLRRFLAQMP
ncbi:MAG TPA: hypothetical protein VLF59_04990 [Candidatus Saccharimonadales bacterium]|nr:hypothetical protein [Candidatus Saccharimonadales bacterium]